MSSVKPGSNCCLSIQYFLPSKPLDQHNAAYWCGQWITCSTVSLSVRHLRPFKLFYYFQRSSHLMTPHILHKHFDRHRNFHIGRLFAACWNTDMSVSTLEVSLLCYEQYFNLQCLDMIYLLISPNVR